MIDFMVIGLPRSGTTWASNWLTTDTTHCMHDPLYTVHYEDWDSQVAGALECRVGVSCTGIWRWVEWLNEHPAKKVLLHREYDEVRQSMEQIGLGAVEREAPMLLASVRGLHVNYTDLFETTRAEAIWDYLIGSPFNAARHKELIAIEMQPKFSGLSVGKEVTRKLMDELYAAARY